VKGRWFVAGLVVFSLGFWATGFAEGKTGYVDLQKIFQGYKKAHENEKKFKEEVEAQQKEINRLQDKIKKEQEDFDKKKDLLKAEERQKKEEQLREMVQDFSGRWKEVNQKLDMRREELEKECLDEIVKATRDYGKKNGYSLILDSRVVVYGPEGLDLSEEILKILNK